jgi:heme-degrading monooxygenase HmoA
MHAVVVNVTVAEPGAAVAALNEQVVPQVAQAPGFVAGYWTRKDKHGLSMSIWDSEDAANRRARRSARRYRKA